jgi:hypothetical protein
MDIKDAVFLVNFIFSIFAWLCSRFGIIHAGVFERVVQRDFILVCTIAV